MRHFKVVVATAVVAVLFTACNKESEQPAREVIHKIFVGDSIEGNEVFPTTGLYGENILSDAVTVIKRGETYSMYAVLTEIDISKIGTVSREAGSVEISIKVPREEDFYFLYDKNVVNWRLSRYIPLELTQIYGINELPREFEDKIMDGYYGYYPSFSAGLPSRCHDMLVQVLTDEDYITIEYYITRLDVSDGLCRDIVYTKARTLRVVDRFPPTQE